MSGFVKRLVDRIAGGGYTLFFVGFFLFNLFGDYTIDPWADPIINKLWTSSVDKHTKCTRYGEFIELPAKYDRQFGCFVKFNSRWEKTNYGKTAR